ncbi:MAG: hypothetical protein H7Z21_16270, partial [Hymenobacter sp.]|nr:hypothetical protein [Hymenobacter sp.]
MVRFFRQWWGVLGLCGVIAVVAVGARVRRAKFNQERRYTVGEVYDTAWTLKSGKNAYCRYFFNGKSYTVHANADRLAGQQLLGRRFLVKFHPPNPQRYSVFYLDAPVPDYITDIPAEGWLVPP